MGQRKNCHLINSPRTSSMCSPFLSPICWGQGQKTLCRLQRNLSELTHSYGFFPWSHVTALSQSCRHLALLHGRRGVSHIFTHNWKCQTFLLRLSGKKERCKSKKKGTFFWGAGLLRDPSSCMDKENNQFNFSFKTVTYLLQCTLLNLPVIWEIMGWSSEALNIHRKYFEHICSTYWCS